MWIFTRACAPFRLAPFSRAAINVIGNGVVVHVPALFDEIKGMEEKGVQVRAVLQYA